MKLVTKKISKIEKSRFEGTVHNVELKTNCDDIHFDDLFWVCNNIVVHNCFVKDLNALMSLAKSLGIDPKVMSGAWQKNLEVRPQRDWEKLVGRAVSKSNE